MTDKLLEGMAVQVANMAKTEIKYKHRLSGILAVYFEGEGLRRLRKIEKEVEERVGVAWLNSGRAKDILFGTLCAGASVAPPDAIVVCTAVDRYQPTPAFLALPEEERQRIKEERFPRNYPQYLKPHDALMVVAQSPERVCIYCQKLVGGLLIGEPEIGFGPQSTFEGRLKMFGVEPPAEAMEALAKVMTNSARPS